MKNKFSFIYCNNMYKFNVLWIYLNICKANLLDFTLTMVCIVTNHIFIIMFHGTCCMLYAVWLYHLNIITTTQCHKLVDDSLSEFEIKCCSCFDPTKFNHIHLLSTIKVKFLLRFVKTIIIQFQVKYIIYHYVKITFNLIHNSFFNLVK